MKKKSKNKSKAKIIEEAAVIKQKCVRLKAADENGYVTCVTCGTVRMWNDGMQGGHFISRTCLATKLMEENIHPQCSHCNGPLKGNLIKYTIYMVDMYGKVYVEHLYSLKSTTTHYTKTEAYKLLEEAKAELKQLEGI